MFLVSLAIADLLVAIFVMPFAIVNDMQVIILNTFPMLSHTNNELAGPLVVGSHSLQALDQVKTPPFLHSILLPCQIENN